MGYLVGFTFLYLGYASVVYGVDLWRGKPASLWFLLSGLGSSNVKTLATSGASTVPVSASGGTAGSGTVSA